MVSKLRRFKTEANQRKYKVQQYRIVSFSLLWISVLLVAALTLSTVKAQDSAAKAHQRDSAWIERFEDKIVIKLAALNTAEALVAEGDNFKNVLEPNPNELFRAYFNYRFISFYVNYIPHFLPGNNDDDEKGRTKGLGLGTSLNFRQWFTDIYYSSNKGYYLSNTRDYQPGWQPGDSYVQIPDLVVKSVEGSVGYNTNPRLSLQAASSQTERQLKSAGSFIPRVSYRYMLVDNRSPIISSTQKSSHFQALLGAGYQHTFVVKKTLYFNGSFTPSFGYIFTKLTTRTTAEQQVDHIQGPIYQWDGRLGMGYNQHRFFAGAYLTATSSTSAQGLSSALIADGHVFFQLFAGIRLNAPGFLRKNYNKIFH
jgi:hypothetical protein